MVAEIVQIAKSGKARNVFTIGDYTAINLTQFTLDRTVIPSGTYYAILIGIDHNSVYEGTNRLHFQLAKVVSNIDIAFNYARMNETSSNVGGWKDSKMREYIQSVYNALPIEWREAIVPQNKYTDNTGNNTNIEGNISVTTDRIFLLSEYEVVSKRTNANQYEMNKQQQYEYYALGNSRIRYSHADTSTIIYWWTRSPNYTSATRFCLINNGGNSGRGNGNANSGVAPCFVVG